MFKKPIFENPCSKLMEWRSRLWRVRMQQDTVIGYKMTFCDPLEA
jgi:hypothetical protein